MVGKLKTPGYKKQFSAIEKKLSETEKVAKYVSSEGFRKELANWEPWRLNEKSVETGNNLYIKVAKGYASESFLNWTKEEAERHSITQNQFLASIIESVRKIEWETMKVMAAKGIATEYTLPHLVVGRSPTTDVILFEHSLKDARKKAPEKEIAGLFSKEEAKNQLGGLVSLSLLPYDLRQINAQISGGPFVGGVSSEITIGINDKVVEKLFKDEFNNEERKKTIADIVEEELHYQKYKHNEWQKSKDILAKSTSVGQEFKKRVEIEEAMGIKKIVEEIMQELPPVEKLLEPFYQRISRK